MKNISKERINADIYRAVSSILLSKVSNPKLTNATVLKTELSADGSVCDIFITDSLEDFKKSAGFFRTEVAKIVNLRRMPRLSFILDKGQNNVDRVAELLEKIKETK